MRGRQVSLAMLWWDFCCSAPVLHCRLARSAWRRARRLEAEFGHCQFCSPCQSRVVVRRTAVLHTFFVFLVPIWLSGRARPGMSRTRLSCPNAHGQLLDLRRPINFLYTVSPSRCCFNCTVREAFMRQCHAGAAVSVVCLGQHVVV